MRISDWSSDVCSSDLQQSAGDGAGAAAELDDVLVVLAADMLRHQAAERRRGGRDGGHADRVLEEATEVEPMGSPLPVGAPLGRSVQLFDHDLSMLKEMQSIMGFFCAGQLARIRSEEHTSELQSLMRISYAVFCL